MLKSSRGFTIVELLIVIVVIAILAAITIVAYSGIQNQAKNAQFLSTFDSYEKAFHMINTIDGKYPASEGPGGMLMQCLGEAKHYPKVGVFEEGQCYVAIIGGSPTVLGVINPALNNQLKSQLGTLPGVVYEPIMFESGSIIYWVRGVMYVKQYVSGVQGRLLFVLQNPDAKCGRGVKTTDSNNLTSCSVDFR